MITLSRKSFFVFTRIKVHRGHVLEDLRPLGDGVLAKFGVDGGGAGDAEGKHVGVALHLLKKDNKKELVLCFRFFSVPNSSTWMTAST